MLQHVLYDVAAHIVRCCSTYCTMLQHMLYDGAAHVVRWCKHVLYDGAAHVVRCCSACCTMLQRSAVPGSVGAGAVRQAVPGLPRAGLARVLRVRPLATSAPGLGAFCHICTGTGRTLPHLHRDWSGPTIPCFGTGCARAPRLTHRRLVVVLQPHHGASLRVRLRRRVQEVPGASTAAWCVVHLLWWMLYANPGDSFRLPGAQPARILPGTGPHPPRDRPTSSPGRRSVRIHVQRYT
jgi:hypothetical protein